MALTKKEIEVLELRKKGLRQADIAKRLKITQPAVCGFEQNALRKIHDAKETLALIKNLGVTLDEK